MSTRGRPGWLESLIDFWNEFKRSKTGMTGLGLIIIFAIIAIAFPLVGNEQDIAHWFDQEYWSIEKMTPELSPPAWINMFAASKYPETTDLPITSTVVLRIENLSKNTTLALELIKILQPDTYEKISQAIKRLDQLVEQGRITKEQRDKIVDNMLKQIREALASTYGDSMIVKAYVIKIAYSADLPPVDLALRGTEGPTPPQLKSAGIVFLLVRPDQVVVPLASVDREAVEEMSAVISAGGCMEFTPQCSVFLSFSNYMPLTGDKAMETLSFYSISPLTGLNASRIWVFRLTQLQSALVTGGKISVMENILGPFLQQLNETVNPESPPRIDKAIFLQVQKGMLKGGAPALKGEYQLIVVTYASYNETLDNLDVPITIDRARLMGVYGMLGTDSRGRDLWQGLLYGVQWALIIGLLTSVLSTLIGVIYGVISGYYGGVVDAVMNRFAQIVYSLPVLPLLILLSYYIGKSIWIIVLLLVAFGWVGLVFTVRSMALQLRESLYVEAARALGATDRRIILRYIFPQVLPYTFASIALGVPGAILAEAGLSFLGLGDPSIVTWGKLLHDAQQANAVLNNAWWWVVPPGLAIALVGMSFVFLGYTLDAILNPKLRR